MIKSIAVILGVLSIILIVLRLPQSAQACLSSPDYYSSVSNDGKYLLVNVNIQTKYKQSGLYLNDGSNQLIHVSKAYDFSADEIFVFDEGKYVVTLSNLADGKLAFYKEGVLTKSYETTQLGLETYLPDHCKITRLKQNNVRFEPQSATLLIENEVGERYGFDARTGKLITTELNTSLIVVYDFWQSLSKFLLMFGFMLMGVAIILFCERYREKN